MNISTLQSVLKINSNNIAELEHHRTYWKQHIKSFKLHCEGTLYYRETLHDFYKEIERTSKKIYKLAHLQHKLKNEMNRAIYLQQSTRGYEELFRFEATVPVQTYHFTHEDN